MINASQITLRRSGRTLLNKVDLSLKAGQFTVLIGPNGAGKSTLLKAISGEIRPDSGTIRYGNQDLTTLSAAAIAKIRAVLPQSSHLAFPFTAIDVVKMGAIAHGSLHPETAALHALNRVGMSRHAKNSYNALSGGEQQRVQLARVLAQIPMPVENGVSRAMFLDEPTSSLDIGQQIAMLEIAKQFADAGGTVLAILHDLNLAAEFADHLVVLSKGQIAAQGRPLDTLCDETLENVYGISGVVGRLPPENTPFILPQARNTNAA